MATVIGQPFTLNDWLVEPSLNRISRGDEIVKIDPQNMKVLELLASKPGEVFSQTEIEQYAWPGVVVTPNSVYQSIAQLRRALGDSKASPAYIETIPRRGYRLVARVLCPTEMDTSVRQTFDAHSTSKPSPRRKAKAWHVGLATTVTAGALAFTSLRLPSALETTRPDDGVHQRLAEATDVSDVFSDPLQPARRQSEALVLSANTAMADGMPRKARELFLKALSLERQESGDGHRRLGPILSGLGRVSLWLRDYDAAETFLLEALSTYDSSPPLYGRRIETMAEVGYALLEIGKYEQAEKYLVQALELSRSVYGDVAFLTPAIISDLGAIHLARGHVDEAERLVRQAIELGEQARTELLELVHLRALLSEVLVAKGEHEMALRETETELQMLAGKVRSDHPFLAACQERLGRILILVGQYDRAELSLRTALKLWKANDGWNWRVASTMSALGGLYLVQGRLDESSQLLARASQLMPEGPYGHQERIALMRHEERIRDLAFARTQAGARDVTVAGASKPSHLQDAQLLQ